MKTIVTFSKMKYYFFAISFFSCIHLSTAQNITWVGGVDADFYNVKNWDNPAIDFTNLINVNLIIGPGKPNNPVNIGYSGNETMNKRPATLTTTPGANIIVTGNFFPNTISNLNGTITLEKIAVFNLRNHAYLGKGAAGILNIDSGKAAVKNNFYVGNGTGGDGVVTVNAGTSLEVGGSLEIGAGVGDPKGVIRIKGGTVTVESAINIGLNGYLHIAGEGKLIVNGNKEAQLKAWVKNKTIGCTVGKKLEVIFDGKKTTVTITKES